MCLIVFAWRPEHPQPLVLAANRDEFYDRACLPLAEWPEVPGLYAGRDLLAGGTWLGVTAGGRFAALTNIRDPRQPKGERSRGELPVEFLRGEANAADFLAGLLPCVEQYSGFNLLLGDSHGLFFLNSERGEVERLQPGLYGLSNADLDTPWPKVLRASSSLAAALDSAEPAQLLELLADRQQPPRVLLPDTGVGLDWEMLLATIFIVGPGYGTRASTALVLQRDGGLQLLERSFGRRGEPIGEVRLALP